MEASHHSFQLRERIRSRLQGLGAAMLVEGNDRAIAADRQPRIEAEKRITARLLRLLRRFEEERVTAIVEFLEGGGRRLTIRHEIDEDRDDVAESGQFGEPFARRDDGDVAHWRHLRSPRSGERVTRLELATSSLARRCSTTELHPHLERVGIMSTAPVGARFLSSSLGAGRSPRHFREAKGFF